MNANRMKFLEEKQEKHKEELLRSSRCKFSPNLSSKSLLIAKSSEKRFKLINDKLPIHDYLLEKGKETSESRIEKEQYKTTHELDNCTFKPYVSPRSNEITNLNTVSIFQRLTRDSEKAKLCKKLHQTLLARDVKRDIMKPQKARKTHNATARMQKRSSQEREFKQNIDQPTEFSVKQDNVICFNSAGGGNPSDSRQENGHIPQLFIDVHLDDQSIHRLIIYEGDRAEDLAHNF